MIEVQPANQTGDQKTRYWASVGFRVREGFKMHQVTGQLDKGPDSWRNITEHCLVEVARAEVLGRWLGLPEGLIAEVRTAAFLHDYDKNREIAVNRAARAIGGPVYDALEEQAQESDDLLRSYGFNERVVRFASAAGGLAPQLFEVKRILDQPEITEDDWAYLLVHYVDDCSMESKWVPQNRVDETGRSVNVIDDRAEENKKKGAYAQITKENEDKLKGHPFFEGMNNFDAMAVVSHQIEQKLAQRIQEITGEVVDPLAIPELVDRKITEDIAR